MKGRNETGLSGALEARLLSAAVLALTTLLGLALNAALVYVSLTTRLRKINFIVVNLGIIYILQCLVHLDSIAHLLAGGLEAHSSECTLSGLGNTWLGFASAWVMALVGLEKCVGTLRPLRKKVLLTLKHKAAASGLVYGASLALCVPPLLKPALAFRPLGLGSFCGLRLGASFYAAAAVALGLALPTLLIVVGYLLIRGTLASSLSRKASAAAPAVTARTIRRIHGRQMTSLVKLEAMSLAGANIPASLSASTASSTLPTSSTIASATAASAASPTSPTSDPLPLPSLFTAALPHPMTIQRAASRGRGLGPQHPRSLRSNSLISTDSMPRLRPIGRSGGIRLDQRGSEEMGGRMGRMSCAVQLIGPCFLLSWLPLQASGLWADEESEWVELASLLPRLWVLWSPVLYGLSDPSFRFELAALWPFKRCLRRPHWKKQFSQRQMEVMLKKAHPDHHSSLNRRKFYTTSMMRERCLGLRSTSFAVLTAELEAQLLSSRTAPSSLPDRPIDVIPEEDHLPPHLPDRDFLDELGMESVWDETQMVEFEDLPSLAQPGASFADTGEFLEFIDAAESRY